jgi:cysteinyl-tRNA synthetase
MSKSLGNDVSLRNVLDTWGREVILLFFMTAHWRKPIDFTDDTLAQTKAQLDSFRNAFLGFGETEGGPAWDEFEAALDDDFNTPEALAIMHAWRAARRLDLLVEALMLFGLQELSAHEPPPPEVIELQQQRSIARTQRDWEEADRLRLEIEKHGWAVRDGESSSSLAPLR